VKDWLGPVNFTELPVLSSAIQMVIASIKLCLYHSTHGRDSFSQGYFYQSLTEESQSEDALLFN
jgi:hypothetical protein